MRRALLVATVLLPLGGCTWLAGVFGGTPTAQTKTTIVEVFADACHAYASTLRLATQALQANLLTDQQIVAVDQARGVATPICTGPQPTNFAVALVSVTEATANVALASKGN